jgi:prevent-host-death family protein
MTTTLLPWTIQDAKARLSEILRRASSGTPQYIGRQDKYVILTEKHYQRIKDERGPTGPSTIGRKLLLLSPRVDEFDLPSRSTSRPDPFQDSNEQDSNEHDSKDHRA